MYDSWEGHYIIHTPRGAVKFYKDKQGLPYIDLEASTKTAVMLLQSTQPEETTGIETAMTLVQTVRENYKGHTKREVLKAKEAGQGQAMIGNPSKGDYRGLVSRNMISNCPIAPTDITNAIAIFGPDLASVQGKTVRRTPAPVVADHVLMDFYNQNPFGCPNRCKYISLGGGKIRKSCELRDWSLTDEVIEVDISRGDLAKFCAAIGQSLDNFHVMASESLSPYIVL